MRSSRESDSPALPQTAKLGSQPAGMDQNALARSKEEWSYRILLIALAFHLLLVMGMLGYVMRQVAGWGLILGGIIFLLGLYAGATLAVLVARWTGSPSAPQLTRKLSFALLPLIPFGTIVGVFGLMFETPRAGVHGNQEAK